MSMGEIMSGEMLDTSMKVVTWLSLDHDPRKGIRNGRCVFTGEYPGIFCVPLGEFSPEAAARSINTFWFEPERGREVQVIFEVPLDALVGRRNGIEKPLDLGRPSGKIPSIRSWINWCLDDDNALVIKVFNPDWIISVKAYRWADGFSRIVEDEIPNNLWD